MLTEMGNEGVMPTVDTFNTLMDACIRRVNPAAVPRLFDQMVHSGAQSSTSAPVPALLPPSSPNTRRLLVDVV